MAIDRSKTLLRLIKFAMTPFSSKEKYQKLATAIDVLQNTQYKYNHEFKFS